jgi:exodeoxyribonuclease V
MNKDFRRTLINQWNIICDEYTSGFYNAVDTLHIDSKGDSSLFLKKIILEAKNNNPEYLTNLYMSAVECKAQDPSAVSQVLFGSERWLIDKNDLFTIINYRNDVYHRKRDSETTEELFLKEGAAQAAINSVLNVLDVLKQPHFRKLVFAHCDFINTGCVIKPSKRLTLVSCNDKSSSRLAEEVELTSEQNGCIRQIQDWFLNSKDRYFVVSGEAGSGKTTVLTELIKRSNLNLKSFIVASPTTKAREVLRSKLPEREGFRARLRTVASVVYKYARPKYDGQDLDFQKIGFKSPSSDRRLEGVAWLIVDEASMITKEQHEQLTKYYRVIYFGDPDQLPPVIDEKSKDVPAEIFDKTNFMLKTIHRQSDNSPIIEVANKAKKGDQMEFFFMDEAISFYDEKDKNLTCDEFDRLLLDHDVVITGRNVTRIMLNQKIRTMNGLSDFPGDSIPKPGEFLVATESHYEKDIANGQRLQVIEFLGEVDIRNDNVSKEYPDDKIMDYKVRVAVEGNTESTIDLIISSQMLRGSHIRGNKIVTKDISGPASDVLRCDWGYVITVHKAQGSEWNKVLVIDDIVNNERIPKRNWNYVAYTRAIERLSVVTLSRHSIYL